MPLPSPDYLKLSGNSAEQIAEIAIVVASEVGVGTITRSDPEAGLRLLAWHSGRCGGNS